MNFKQATCFLDSLINYERTASPYYDFKLERFRNLLKDLGNPQEKLKNVILVAGTKGKGSVCHFLESALDNCGLRTGHFTKPHLFSVCERVRVSKQPIGKIDFARLIAKIKSKVIKHKCTYFEAITALAFLYFLENDLDYTILEVGLGGRLDSTNVTEPIVSVITRIGLDHTEVLGDSISKIASEKSAIIHNQAYVVCSQQRPMALKIIKKRVLETDSKLFLMGRDLKIENEKVSIEGCRFTAKLDNKRVNFDIPVLGRHQIENAATGLGVLQRLMAFDKRINWDRIIQGFKQVKIPARCQIVRDKPMIIVDVAHNPDSALALAETIQEILVKDVTLIFGASKEKLVKEMLKILSPITKRVILTRAKSPRAYDPKDLAELIEPYSISFQLTKSVKEAIGEMVKTTSKDELVVITGSFYVAGEALKFIKAKI
ncbi:MAG: bifunctional folylpolyglutamate synthase/dihydrofolate synthase [candidate division WOR-3 bacterium]|nr:bifunctional folylpolyglutamate synthase/dihydrofolate synthase [candidate division WOR-3 bacterium]MDH5684001.1 bifunctional folylpolyglutamate synthase/dihydrofolate synthase [candidate division WOR-3 bacterium]